MSKVLRDNWYRDLWLLAVTVLVYISLSNVEAGKREAVNSNIEARYSDCRGGNDTREALRKRVQTSKIERPFLLKLLPQLDTPSVLALITKNEAEELAGFAPRNCVEYAEEALPGHRKRYTLRISN
jgi:hypothetical protein